MSALSVAARGRTSADRLARYSIVPAALVGHKDYTYKLPDQYPSIDPVNYLGALGMSGLTAYSSLAEIGQPKAGETIWVSSAAGSVGEHCRPSRMAK